MSLLKFRNLGFLFLCIFFLSTFTISIVKADSLYYYLGPDISPDGLTLTDLSVEGKLDQGDRLIFYFVLSNQPDNPPIELSNKGIFVQAFDPEGNDKSFGFIYQREIIEPGQSLIFYDEFFPDLPGDWTFWPSYEIQIGEEKNKGPNLWHTFNPLIASREMPDLTPLSLTLTPTLPSIGDDVRINLITENIGSRASSECNGAMFIGNTLWTAFNIPPLDPGENTVNTLDWIPSEQGLWNITLYVDYWDAIRENNESNNFIELNIEIINEGNILLFTSNPKVTGITQTSATIEWETNVESEGKIYYGSTAGLYSSTVSEDAYTRSHSVRLTGLKPSITYHFLVISHGLHGNIIQSKEMTFRTTPSVDNIIPTLSIFDSGLYQGIIEIKTDASDNVGVEKTEYFIDDQLAFTDFSPPYLFSLDTSALENGVHMLKVVATDYSGQSITEKRPIDVVNIKDENAPKVEITTPADNDVLIGEVQVTASLSDDTGLAYVFFKIDGQTQGFKGLPSNPEKASTTFTWDTTEYENGQYRIGIEVYDHDLKNGFDIVDININNPPKELPPTLKVVDHTVTRQDNHFYISLTIQNLGDTDATDVIITEYSHSFQPISKSDNFADYKAQYIATENTGVIRIESKVDISPTWSYTYTYEAIPILFHGLVFLPDPNSSTEPSIGNTIKLMYRGEDGSNYYEELSQQVLMPTDEKSINASYDKAVKFSDYLLITDPQQLFNIYSTSEVNNLLSTMAELASHEEGVLGYITTSGYGKNQAIHDLIKQGGEWNSKLKNGWSSNGYLLLVGETEIIPSWLKNLGTYETTAGSYTWNVLTDLPYANTVGDESQPELSIGRIIGNNARELNTVLKNSLNVLLKSPGYEFDRSHVLLVSGFPDKVMGNFNGQVDAVSSVISQKSPSTSQSKIDAPDYMQYDSSGKIDEALTKGAIEYIFFSSTKGKDIVFLAGHGNWDHWDKISNSAVSSQSDPFGWVTPFIFASSCKTGDYSQGYSVAESFLQRGAAVYLGATESGGWTYYSKRFFEMWDTDESISLAVKQVKKSLGNDLKDRIWTNSYHVYGDSKYGSTNSLLKTILYTASTPSVTPSSIEIQIPEYTINRIYDEDYVEIPGGSDYFEIGKPLIPSYKVSFDYPKGIQIQDVNLVQKTNPVTISGLNVPESVLTLPEGEITALVIQTGDSEWWPDRDYEWTVIQNPENSTLVITIYPFSYNQWTNEAKFSENFDFFINHTTSNIEITRISTDKHDYALGDSVKIDLQIKSTQSNTEDILFNTVVKDENTGAVVDGLELRILKDMRGEVSYSAIWNSTNFRPGNYVIIVELRDSNGALLDEKVENIRIGIGSGEILSLNVNQETYENDDNVQISLAFENSGNTDLSGTVIIKLLNSTNLIQKYEHRFSDLTPSQTIEVTDTWEAGTANDTIKIIGYAMFEGYTTPTVMKQISITSSNPTPSSEVTEGISGFPIGSILLGVIIVAIIIGINTRQRRLT